MREGSVMMYGSVSCCKVCSVRRKWKGDACVEDTVARYPRVEARNVRNVREGFCPHIPLRRAKNQKNRVNVSESSQFALMAKEVKREKLYFTLHNLKPKGKFRS